MPGEISGDSPAQPASPKRGKVSRPRKTHLQRAETTTGAGGVSAFNKLEADSPLAQAATKPAPIEEVVTVKLPAVERNAAPANPGANGHRVVSPDTAIPGFDVVAYPGPAETIYRPLTALEITANTEPIIAYPISGGTAPGSVEQGQSRTASPTRPILPKRPLTYRSIGHRAASVFSSVQMLPLRKTRLEPYDAAEHALYSRDDGIFGDSKFSEYITAQIEVVIPGTVAGDTELAREAAVPQSQASPAMQAEIAGATKGAALMGAGTMVGNVFKYGSSLLIQRGFGVGLFGLYSLGMSVISLIISVFNLGLDDAMVRYVSIYKSKKQPGLLRGLNVFCSVAAGAAGILGALLVFLLAPYLARIMHAPDVIPLLRMMALIVPLSSIQGVWSGGLQGFKEFKMRLLTKSFIVPMVMIFGLVFVLIFFPHIEGVIVVTIISTGIGTVLCLYFFLRKLSTLKGRGEQAKEYQGREWLGFAVPNFMTSITDMVLDAVDTMLLAFFAIPAFGLGWYAAANKLSIFIAMPLLSFNGMFAPVIAELYSKGEHQKLAIMFKIVTKWTIIFSLPIFLILTLFSKDLLGISGEGFVGAWPLLVVLSIGNLVNAGTGSVGYMLLMTGYQRISFINSLVAVIVNLVLGIILTPRYGAMGVAIATGLALAVVNLMRLLQVRVLLKIQPYQWDVLKPLGAGLISIVITAILLHFVGSSHWSVELIGKHVSLDLLLVPLFLVLYVWLLMSFKFNADDAVIIGTLRKKIRGSKQ